MKKNFLLLSMFLVSGFSMGQSSKDPFAGFNTKVENSCYTEVRSGDITVPNALVDGEIFVFTTNVVDGKRVKVAVPAKFDSNEWMVVRRKAPKKKIYKKPPPPKVKIVQAPPIVKKVPVWNKHEIMGHLGRGFNGLSTQGRDDSSVDVQPNEDIIFGVSYGYKPAYRYKVMGTLFNNGNLSAGVGYSF